MVWREGIEKKKGKRCRVKRGLESLNEGSVKVEREKGEMKEREG